MTLIADYQRLMRPVDEAAHIPDISPRLSGAATTGIDHSVAVMLRAAHALLAEDLIARVHSQRPEFFEYLVIDVLLAMGYGNRRSDMAQRLGRTGDGGVDGVIALDELGLDQVCIQAKRLRPGNPVPIGEVRDFAGSLEARHASKGVFVTTTHFSPGAPEFCSRLTRRVVLIDGSRLAELMIRHNIGVKVRESFYLRQIDNVYFSRPPGS